MTVEMVASSRFWSTWPNCAGYPRCCQVDSSGSGRTGSDRVGLLGRGVAASRGESRRVAQSDRAQPPSLVATAPHRTAPPGPVPQPRDATRCGGTARTSRSARAWPLTRCSAAAHGKDSVALTTETVERESEKSHVIPSVERGLLRKKIQLLGDTKREIPVQRGKGRELCMVSTSKINFDIYVKKKKKKKQFLFYLPRNRGR